jgi:hypothetical protein
MPLRLMSILLLAGCAASEPKNVSYARLPAAAPSVQAGPPMAPSMQASDAMAASSATNPLAETSPFGDTMHANESEIAAGVPEGATNCSTVDGVTLCDAPAGLGFEESGEGGPTHTN